MTHFRFRWIKLGGHIHVRVWTAPGRELTHSNNGHLTFREEEWDDFVRLVGGFAPLAAIEIVHESALLS